MVLTEYEYTLILLFFIILFVKSFVFAHVLNGELLPEEGTGSNLADRNKNFTDDHRFHQTSKNCFHLIDFLIFYNLMEIFNSLKKNR